MAGNYVFEITIPAQTTEDAPQEKEIILSAGIIDEISIGFPQGCSALAHLRIKEEESVLFPSNPNTDYAWNDTIYTFNPKHLLVEQNPILTLMGWNDDSFYQHTITVIINVTQLPPIVDALSGLLNSYGVL